MTLLYGKFADTLKEVEHRPYSVVSDSPWIMNQVWANLLFAHWSVDVVLMRRLVPADLELDLFEGKAYLGVVPFEMKEVSPRFVPSMPWISWFPELNVRTYVRHKGRAGVYFFSLDAGNPLAVYLACQLYHLPYYNAEMRCEQQGEKFVYTSKRKMAQRNSRSAPGASPRVDEYQLDVTYWPCGPVYLSRPGTLDSFLTERYCLFTTRGGNVYCGEIHHRPWPLQPAKAEWRANTMSTPLGFELPGEPVLHFVGKIETLEWAIART